MIVVDVNAIAYLWIRGPRTEAAEKTLRRDPRWAAPVLWKSEFCSVLCGYLRRGDLSMDAALRCLAGAEEHLCGSEYAVPSAAILREAAHSRCPAYDCEYVALAIDLGVKLVTCDRRILREFPRCAVDLEMFASGA